MPEKPAWFHFLTAVNKKIFEENTSDKLLEVLRACLKNDSRKTTWSSMKQIDGVDLKRGEEITFADLFRILDERLFIGYNHPVGVSCLPAAAGGRDNRTGLFLLTFPQQFF